MNTTKLETASKNILSSGLFLTFGTEPTKLSFVIDDRNFAFNFVFLANETNSQSLEYDTDGATFSLKFYNFNSNLGINNINPLEFGVIGSRHLFGNFNIYLLNDQTQIRKIEYTFYLDK